MTCEKLHKIQISASIKLYRNTPALICSPKNKRLLLVHDNAEWLRLRQQSLRCLPSGSLQNMFAEPSCKRLSQVRAPDPPEEPGWKSSETKLSGATPGIYSQGHAPVTPSAGSHHVHTARAPSTSGVLGSCFPPALQPRARPQACLPKASAPTSIPRLPGVKGSLPGRLGRVCCQ